MTRSEMNYSQKQILAPTLAPQLRQALKILQVSALELRETILDEIKTNPVLEELPSENMSFEGVLETPPNLNQVELQEDIDPFLDSKFKALNEIDQEWKEETVTYRESIAYNPDDTLRHQHMLNSLSVAPSLQEHLQQQINLQVTNESQNRALIALIGNLTDRGYLTITVEEIARQTDLEVHIIETARQLLKSLDPIGLGSYTLQECLLEQIKRISQKHTLALTIVHTYYALFLRRRIPEIAHKTAQSVQAVEAAFKFIASLDPAPGRRFSPDTNHSITPDVSIYKENEQWKIVLNNDYIPRVRISHLYKNLTSQIHLDPKDKTYIQDKVRSGRFLIKAIEQRQQTIERITQQILHFQLDFFELGVSKLHPLTMNQVAQVIGVHETTVSRAIANKYILTPHGLYEFRYFFTSGYQTSTSEHISNTSIKDRITQIIHAEDPMKPYSDQDISDILKEHDVTVARRTVAKYREELGILATHLRKRYS